MTKIDLGCISFPLSGPFSHGVLIIGLAIGCLCSALTLAAAPTSGPAARAEDVIEASRGAILASIAWIVIYYNYIGINVASTLLTEACWGVYSSADRSPKSGDIAARYAGNMFGAYRAGVFETAIDHDFFLLIFSLF